MVATGSSVTSFGYTGQRSEAGFGLIYLNARWYDPVQGRFTQPDSIVPNPANPMDWDRYAYVRNNPMNYTDPSGHCRQAVYGVCVLGENGQGNSPDPLPYQTSMSADPAPVFIQKVTGGMRIG